jgi:hypothetical protein
MTSLKYLSLVAFLFLISCNTSSQVSTSKGFVGQYISVDSKFEKSSILTLNSDSTFSYSYMLGGCQDRIKGMWTVKNKSIILQTDNSNDSKSYHVPDLNSIKWTITSKGLKPSNTIDNGCFKESALHKKSHQKNCECNMVKFIM